jgi:hypothetical protein
MGTYAREQTDFVGLRAVRNGARLNSRTFDPRGRIRSGICTGQEDDDVGDVPVADPVLVTRRPSHPDRAGPGSTQSCHCLVARVP